MNREQSSGLEMVERRDIRLEDLDLLSQAVSGPPVIDDDDAKDSVTGFLETFATPVQLDVFEKAKEDLLVRDSSEETLWRRFRPGILWHPAIIGKLATLSGAESLTDIGEEAWKDKGACKEDIRFVSPGSHRKPEETRELMDICEGCPVLAKCHQNVVERSLQYGFWAGVARSRGVGYNDDGVAITLEEKREMMDAKQTKAS